MLSVSLGIGGWTAPVVFIGHRGKLSFGMNDLDTRLGSEREGVTTIMLYTMLVKLWNLASFHLCFHFEQSRLSIWLSLTSGVAKGYIVVDGIFPWQCVQLLAQPFLTTTRAFSKETQTLLKRRGKKYWTNRVEDKVCSNWTISPTSRCFEKPSLTRKQVITAKLMSAEIALKAAAFGPPSVLKEFQIDQFKRYAKQRAEAQSKKGSIFVRLDVHLRINLVIIEEVQKA
jgi:hypothetical protein